MGDAPSRASTAAASTDPVGFQDSLVAEGPTETGYRASVEVAAECVREAGFAVEFPASGHVVGHLAVDPENIVTFDVVVDGEDPTET